MPKKVLKELDEQDLGDIILCEPITNRGIEALQNLGLYEVISENDFFDKMYIKPKYDKKASFIEPNTDAGLEYVYSVSEECFNEMKKKFENFNKKFTSNARSQSPLLIIGTAGNGKSIETHSKIKNLKRDNEETEFNHIFYNFEKALSELTYETTFSLNKFLKDEEIDALWLTCMVLLDGLYNLVKNNCENIQTIVNNHQKHFLAHNSADDSEKMLFSCIKAYDPADSSTVKNLFSAMSELIDTDKDKARQSIENLLKMTMNVMYCIGPENKNYIVFDNFEHYIKLNAQNIPIHNEALAKIFSSAMNVTDNVINIYDRIKTDESWRAFKIILVLRRTSEHLLMQSSVHYPTKYHDMRYDYTGHFDIWHIWEKKKEFIWEIYLKDKYEPGQSSAVLWIIDEMMKDKPGILSGTSYQELIAALMNSGIRRNGRAQAHAAMRVHKILIENHDCHINFEKFKELLPARIPGVIPNEDLSATRYMYRRALLEIQYRWMIISDDSKLRFENLFLGKLSDEEDSDKKDRHGNTIKMRKVKLDHNGNNTLVRRILSYLSHSIDKNASQDNIRVFKTIFLYDLMAGVFLNPTEDTTKELNRDDHFLPLSTVLISLGNMAHGATKCAPLVVLNIDDSRFDSSESEKYLADILIEIWEAETKKDTDNGKYKRDKYSVRLTEAGDAFLRDIQPSFSFFAALYCSEEVPLFFLTDPERIKFVISSVYEAADKLCEKYEATAGIFCGTDTSLVAFNSYKYLPKYNNNNDDDKNNYITFRKRVKEMHINHLVLYRDFIEKNAKTLSLNDKKDELTQHINDTIDYYKKWAENKGVECF